MSEETRRARFTVQFDDGSTENVVVDTSAAQSSDHIAELVAQAASRPDDVDDFWEEG